ncbi:MAG: response regulator transcription factor [Bacteroidetes bacterium]|jgi:two-component system, LytTR family, response regulator|nr:response regulator transcription factor [Bacteroidota bacterium]MBT3748541.1 response regulator transcription factor [Bacteroidota bacterium]MBT4411250.1 response regulator transcription factor [Bacteroidota bacterium]MBT5426087.1 response regulator transcription factor [Bacteroidota bacterium]MBT7094899.1 response regulator transcription factor [Bacteroidota bacterium]
MRTIIIDDEQDALDNLNFLLKKYCSSVEVIASFTSARAAITRLAELEFDLLFLDIEMPQLSGFDFLDRLQKTDFQLIFVTSYNQYALKAFRYSALDYILKPIDIEELQSSVEKANQRSKQHYPVQPHLDQLKQFNQGLAIDRIALPLTNGYKFVPLASISIIEADGRYCKVFFTNPDPLLVCINLKEFQELLESSNFFRIHHTYLINLNHMSGYNRSDGGWVEMENGKSVPVSRRKKPVFEQMLKTLLPGKKG